MMREQYEELLSRIMQKDYSGFEETMDKIMKQKLIDKVDPIVQELDQNIFDRIRNKGADDD